MKFNLVGYVSSMVLGALMLSSSGDLHAGWGMLHGGSSGGGGSSGYSSVGGSSGGYGGGSSGYVASYSSYGGGASGGSSGGPGILQRFAGRVHDHMAAKRARHAARRAYYGSSGNGSSGGGSSGYASYGSSGGGSSGGYATSYSGGSSGGSTGYSSGVSYGSTGYSSGVNYGSTGYSSSYGGGDVYHGASNLEPSQETGALVSDVETATFDDAVYLTVAVPTDAKLFVNDSETSSSGVVRKFVSRGLKSGKQYRFQLRAEMKAADGQLMTEEKTLVVSAGDEQQVQFAFAEQDSPVETAITLNLPEGAKVVLAGNPTQATGETRTFRTKRLKTGELWDDYEIAVEYEGKVKHQSIRLVGGDKLQLTFDFEQSAATIAAR